MSKREMIRILFGIKFRLEKSMLNGKRKNAIFSNSFMNRIINKSIKIKRLYLSSFVQTSKIFERKNRLK